MSAPSKKELEQAVRHWQFEAMSLKGANEPWLKIPGLVVFLDKTEAYEGDIAGRLEVLEMALRTLKRRPHP